MRLGNINTQDMRTSLLVMVPALAFLTVLVLLPLLKLLDVSFTAGGGWSLQNYAAISSADVGRASLNSLVLAFAGTSIAMVLGTILAWLAARTDIPMKSMVNLAGITPLFFSVMVASVAWSMLASGRAGYLNLALRELGLPFSMEVQSLPGIAFVLGLYYAPYPFMLMYTSFRLIHPDLEEAAGVHGAGLWDTLRQVTIPLVLPAFLGSALLVAALIVEDFPVPQILGGPAGIETLSMRIYKLATQVPPSPGEASAVSIALVLVVFMFIFMQRAVLHGGDYQTVTGKGMQPRVLKLGAWRWPAICFVGLYVLSALILPIAALVISALRRNLFVRNLADLFDVSSMSFATISRTLGNPRILEAATNTLLTATFAAVIGTALFFVIAVIVYRTEVKGRAMLEYLAMIPVAIPALVMGLGILWSWIDSPLNIYGTLAILVVAYVTRFLPQGYRAIAGSMSQIHRDLESAAQVSGASRLNVVLYITFPLMRGGIVASAILLFVLSVRELTASLFLYTTNTRVLSIAIYELYETGSWGAVASVSLAYTSVLGLIVLVTRRWLRGES